MKEELTSESPEGMVLVDGRQVMGGEYVSGGGIRLEVAQMVANDPLDVDAGRMVGKDKVDLIADMGRKRGAEGRSAGDGLDLAKSPVNYNAGKSLVEEESGGSLVKIGMIRTDMTASEELGKWNRVFTGRR
eukprot:g46865.t1